MESVGSDRVRQMRDLLRKARTENSRKVAEAFRARSADGRFVKGARARTAMFDASEQAGARLLKSLNRAAAVEARWKTMSFSGS